jgi:hypothetical protein
MKREYREVVRKAAKDGVNWVGSQKYKYLGVCDAEK